MDDSTKETTSQAKVARDLPTLSAKTIVLKSSGLAILIVFSLFLITGLVFLGVVNAWFGKFSESAGISRSSIVTEVRDGLRRTPSQTNFRKNFLILGSDALPTRGESSVLTDTIMLVSLNTQTGAIQLLSFPRDLWLSDEQTRINALYHYGKERNPANPLLYPVETLSSITQVPIHHALLLSMNDLETIIDAVGGVEITVATGFTDTQFPRTDVDVTVERDPAKLYETVTFASGSQLMDGKRALQYMRSRHAEGDEGTDLARATRQQQIVAALLSKMSAVQTLIKEPEKLGSLFALYVKIAQDTLPLSEVVATAKSLQDAQAVTQIQLTSHSLSIATATESGSIIHPPTATTKGQWVYTIPDLQIFRDEIRQKLDL